MRKLFLLLALILPSLSAHAMEPFRVWCENGGQQLVTSGLLSTGLIQASYPGCTVIVYFAGTTNKAPIFQNNLTPPTTQSNPYQASTINGFSYFYAPNGRYDVVLMQGTSGGFPQPVTYNDVLLCDPTDNTGAFVCTGGAGQQLTIYHNGVRVGSEPILNIIDTPTVTATLTDTGTQITFLNAAAGGGGGGGQLCTTLVTGGLDVNPQTCAGAKTLQGLAGFPSNTVFQVLNPAGNVQLNGTSYSGDAISGFDNTVLSDGNGTAQDYLTDAAQSAIGLLNPFDRKVNSGSPNFTKRSDGLVVYSQQNANSTAGTILGSGIKGIFDINTQTTAIPGSLYGGVFGKSIYSTTGNIGVMIGVGGEVYVNSPPAGSTGTIQAMYGLRAFASISGATPQSNVAVLSGLWIENMQFAAAHNYAWGYKGNTSNALPSSLLDSNDNLYIDGGIALGNGINGAGAGGYFTAGTINALGDVLCFSANTTVADCATSVTNPIGIARSTTGGASAFQYPQVLGVATLNYDATYTPSAGWFACTSATTAGKVIVQVAACADGRQVGIVSKGGTSVTSGQVWLQWK